MSTRAPSFNSSASVTQGSEKTQHKASLSITNPDGQELGDYPYDRIRRIWLFGVETMSHWIHRRSTVPIHEEAALFQRCVDEMTKELTVFPSVGGLAPSSHYTVIGNFLPGSVTRYDSTIPQMTEPDITLRLATIRDLSDPERFLAAFIQRQLKGASDGGILDVIPFTEAEIHDYLSGVLATIEQGLSSGGV